MSEESAIRLSKVRFGWRGSRTPLLKIDDFRVVRGERLFLYGPSGSGKSTLLNLMAGVLLPQQGSVHILGQDLTGMRTHRRDLFRARHIGVIFQQLNLIPYLDMIENVIIASHFARMPAAEAEKNARLLLQTLDLAGLERQRATALSIGQQQRVAVARALVTHPEILIADEPTSALDSDNRETFMDLLLETAGESNTTVVFVSHDRSLQAHFDRHLDIGELNAPVVAA